MIFLFCFLIGVATPQGAQAWRTIWIAGISPRMADLSTRQECFAYFNCSPEIEFFFFLLNSFSPAFLSKEMVNSHLDSLTKEVFMKEQNILAYF